MNRTTDWLLAFAGGIILAVMINFNSLLAKHSTPSIASWVAHGAGAVVALFFVIIYARIFPSKRENSTQKAPLWAYFGGIPGALTVILAAITVNSSLALSGTLAFMLVGQVIFGIISDHFGLFGIAKRKFTLIDVFVIICILSGSVLLIFFRN